MIHCNVIPALSPSTGILIGHTVEFTDADGNQLATNFFNGSETAEIAIKDDQVVEYRLDSLDG